jgi:hypothetical protein
VTEREQQGFEAVLRRTRPVKLPERRRLEIDPGAFGAAFFIQTAVVPPLLVTHALICMLLPRR